MSSLSLLATLFLAMVVLFSVCFVTFYTSYKFSLRREEKLSKLSLEAKHPTPVIDKALGNRFWIKW